MTILLPLIRMLLLLLLMMMMMMIEYNILRLHLCERLYKISINITPLCNRDTKEATQISVNFEFAVPRFDKSVGFLAWTLSWPMKLAYIIARLAKDNMFKVISWIKASPSNCHLAERGYDSHGSCVFSVFVIHHQFLDHRPDPSGMPWSRKSSRRRFIWKPRHLQQLFTDDLKWLTCTKWNLKDLNVSN